MGFSDITQNSFVMSLPDHGRRRSYPALQRQRKLMPCPKVHAFKPILKTIPGILVCND